MNFPTSRDEYREWYNAKQIAESLPANCINTPIPPPVTFDDYKSLSAIIYRTWNHANQIGYWLRYFSSGETLNYGGTCALLEEAIGLDVLLCAIAQHVLGSREGNLFDAVSNLTPSSHTAAVRKSHNQIRALPDDLHDILRSAIDGMTFGHLAETWDELRPKTWYNDTDDVWNDIRAELAKVKPHFGNNKEPPVSQKPAQERKPRKPKNAKRDALFAKWSNDLTAKEIAAKWNSQKSVKIPVLESAVSKAIERHKKRPES